MSRDQEILYIGVQLRKQKSIERIQSKKFNAGNWSHRAQEGLWSQPGGNEATQR